MFGGMMQKAKLYSQCNHVPNHIPQKKKVFMCTTLTTTSEVIINGIM